MELYIHIPFCIRKCAYCAFDSFAGCSSGEMEEYTSAILREASQRVSLVPERIETVYIGGGTPSLLPADLLEHLVSSLKSIFDMSSVLEFTVEANPGTVSNKWFDKALDCGINRISFGVQAVQDHLLKTLGRIHRFQDAYQSVIDARQCGFRNINTDLIFGIPGQTMSDWRRTLDDIIALSPSHISAYGLIPEKGTPLYRELEKGLLSLPDPETERNMYDTAIQMLTKSGYNQYEISNFASTGFQCRHNIGYWDQVPYLGLGLSAASMIRQNGENDLFSVRWTNPGNMNDYYRLVNHPEELEQLKEGISTEEARFETVMLSLRMTEGMRRGRFTELHGNVPEYWYGSVLEKMKEQGLMDLKEDSWRLTRRGMDIQNSVLLEFMD